MEIKKIIAKGITAEVVKVFYLDWEKDWDDNIKYIDIEFLDSENIHRHYKSHYDGGMVVLVDGTEVRF